MEDQLKILSLNSRGTVGKIGHIVTLTKQYDIICLQEQRMGETLKLEKERLNQLQKLTNCKIYFTKIKDKNLGIALIVKNSHVEFIKN